MSETPPHRPSTGLHLRDWLAEPAPSLSPSPSPSPLPSPTTPEASGDPVRPSSPALTPLPLSPQPSSTAPKPTPVLALPPRAPDPSPSHPRQQTPTPPTEPLRRAPVADAPLVVPDLVRLQLDTALFGDRTTTSSHAHGSTGPHGVPRSKNLTLLVGTVRVRTNRRGQTQRTVTDLGAISMVDPFVKTPI